MTLALGAASAAGAGAADAAVFHVRAGARPGGTGSAAAPFASLDAVQAVAGPGDTIVVDPAPRDAAPLDGGIQLEPGQRLEGGGPAVTGAAQKLTALPVLTNTSASRLDGDAVRLADGATVSNIVVRGAVRGGIYGLDSTGVAITGNDVSGHNTSCTAGFLVQPFNVPTGVPFVGGGVGGNGTLAPQNGWAGIMVDGSRDSGPIAIDGNVVHDGTCGDGIDIRAAGTSDLTARVDGNTVTRLKQGNIQGAETGSVLAIGMQARDGSRLRVTQDGNTETDIGSDGADCEGQFANTSEAGVIVDTVRHNTFRHGIGGFSCNGLEAIVSNGSGSIDVALSDSTFEDNPGDMFEEGNLGAGSTMRWDMENVIARHTTERGANPAFSADPGANPIPFNLGDCMILGHNGGGNNTYFRMRDSVLEGCNNGITALSGLAASNGEGLPQALVLDIDHSRIAGNAKLGLQVLNSTPLHLLQTSVANTEITGSGSFGAAFDEAATATTDRAEIDLGGGALAGAGANCLAGNGKADAEATRYSVAADGNWWGQPGGPADGRAAGSEGGRVSTGRPLAARPGCGPRPRPSPAARRGRARLRVRVRPRRDGRPPYRFTAAGSLVPPAGASRTAACRGRVTIRIDAGRRTIWTRKARVAPDCSFRSRATFAGRRRFRGRRSLSVVVRFGGNSVLGATSATGQRVGVR
ncbi:MAG: hypothetical protein ACJ77M_05365 [Thermoleophilaceae bacterium]